MTQKKFELRVIMSFVHGSCFMETEMEEVLELASHLMGEKVEEEELYVVRGGCTEHVLCSVPDSDKLVRIVSTDKARYAKMIDLYGKMHVIEPIPLP